MISLLVLSFVLVVDDPPQPAPASLVSIDDFKKLRNDPAGIRILDVRPPGEYAKGHVPGAVSFPTKAAEALAAKPDGLTDRAAWEVMLAPLGLKAPVVIYGENRQLDAARVWWLLGYLGVDRVSLLDGNYSLWTKSGGEVSKQSPSITPFNRDVVFRANLLATRADVTSLLKDPTKTRIIDARTIGEHVGTEKRSKKAGRIPEACHLEWSELVDKDGKFLSEKALRAKVNAAGIKPGQAIVTHCQGGGRASVDAFVFQHLGFPTRNYYLGWSDWGNAEGVPVEIGPKKMP